MRNPEEFVIRLPTTVRVLDQVNAGGHGITFLQVALGILARVEKVLGKSDSEYESEFIFLRECLHAGTEQTRLPCVFEEKALDWTNDATVDVSRDMRRTLRKTYSRGSDRDHSGVLHADSLPPAAPQDEPRTLPAPTSAKGETSADRDPKPAKVTDVRLSSASRKDGALRGGLRAVDLCRSSRTASMIKDVFAEGVPWLGPQVPEWPVCIVEANAKKIRRLFQEDFNNWEFDLNELNRLSGAQPLAFVGWESLLRGNFFAEFNIDPAKTVCFLQHAEASYRTEADTPYHNNLHAADVTQTLWSMTQQFGVSLYFDPLDTTASILSALLHDVGHDGRTNAFHINVRDELAIMYNDRSMLENYHVSRAFRLLLVNEKTNILAGLQLDQLAMIRKEIIDMVLSTDMALHFGKLGAFCGFIEKYGQDREGWHSDESSMFLLRGMVLHLADISNPAKSMLIAHQWTLKVLLEFFSQGDAEKNLGITVSPLCDRNTTEVPTSQLGFIDFIVRPSYDALNLLFPLANGCIAKIEHNKEVWTSRTGTTISVDYPQLLPEAFRGTVGDHGGFAFGSGSFQGASVLDERYHSDLPEERGDVQSPEWPFIRWRPVDKQSDSSKKLLRWPKESTDRSDNGH